MARDRQGFTLVESLVAMALVVTIALGTAQLFSIALARNLSAREQLAMTLLASTKVNDLAGAAADGTIAISPSDSLDCVSAGYTDTVVDNGRPYVRCWRVSRVPGFADDVVGIAVRVAPAGGVGDVRVATIREWRRP
ncbi:MAG TPA: prepilin-type N-terminal cleavage/methylation domain-containing protein [Vicinamibacterales bacterium]|nr:prepilin-type N-terminal cleavage/methylation domain-containing protein [Vicinamibacterales bacterium]